MTRRQSDGTDGQHSGALLVAGAASGVGKSTVSAALCRVLSRRGASVAPFKAMNMSNHAAVTADGGEIGRAQAMQADAARVEPDRRMNPVLLKPATNRLSHLVVLGEEQDAIDAEGYGTVTASLRPVVLDALVSLRRRYRWVIAEGAGGAAEINLLHRDLVNLPLAGAAGIPTVLVVDIDKGGAFAAAYGTVALLPPKWRKLVIGIIFNRFRGDPELLTTGIRELQRRCQVPVLGVLPYLRGPLLGVEDSLDIVADRPDSDEPRSPQPVRVAVVRLPHLANPSDMDALALEPDVALRWVTRPDDLDGSDLIIVPGSRATVADLCWLRRRGLAAALIGRAQTQPIVGICAGYQMLGQSIDDTVESGVGRVEGLGLLDVSTRFDRPKVVRLSRGSACGHAVEGYQIRFGRARPRSKARPWLRLDGADEGSVDSQGRVFGTSLHGVFDADGFRRAFLADVAAVMGRRYRPGATTLRAALSAQHDRLADWLEAHADINSLLEAGAGAVPPGQEPGW